MLMAVPVPNAMVIKRADDVLAILKIPHVNDVVKLSTQLVASVWELFKLYVPDTVNDPADALTVPAD